MRVIDREHERWERERLRRLGSDDDPWTCGPPEGPDLNLDPVRPLPGGREGVMTAEELADYWERRGLPTSLAGRGPGDPAARREWMLEEARRRVAESRDRWSRRVQAGGRA